MRARLTVFCVFLVACDASMQTGGTGGESAGTGGSISSGGSGGLGSNQLDIYQSGSRIKMRVGTTPDGAKQWIGWHDMQRNEDCGFQIASDGMTRCLPSAGANISNIYSDAQCTVHMGYYAACSPAPTLAVALGTYLTGGQCDRTVHIFPVTGIYTGNVFQKSGNSCGMITRDPSVAFASLGPEIAASEFQSMTVGIE